MKRTLAFAMAFFLLVTMCACAPKPVEDSSGTSSTTESSATITTLGSGETTTTGGTATDGESDGATTGSNAVTTTTTGKQQSTTTTAKVTNQTVPVNHTYTFDVPVLPGDKSKEVLSHNPNRGLRLQEEMNVENGCYTAQMYDGSGKYKGIDFAGAESSIQRLRAFVKDYAYEAPTMVQTYFYLTYYRDKDLDQTAFNNMNAYFEACRELNLTVALRFAYVYLEGQDAQQDCVSLEQMKRHMEQLKPFLAKNRDVLFCLEVGFIGAWGEQSSGSSWWINGHTGTIVDEVVKMVPDDLWVMVRYHTVYEQASAASQKRLGFHNDYIVGFSHVWDVGGGWNSASFNKVHKLSSTVLMKGEMPWGMMLPDGRKDLSGINVVKYLSNNHYTALSCYHNNREFGGDYDMKDWRSVSVTASLLDKHGLNYYPEWFKTANGRSVFRSLFDYLQQFLGYHLVSSDVTVQKNGTKADVSFSITNYGFAAPLALKEIKLVILDSKNKVVDSKKLCELVDLQAATTKNFKVTMTLPKVNEVYRVGLWLENHNNIGARLANDIDMAGQINLLGTMN